LGTVDICLGLLVQDRRSGGLLLVMVMASPIWHAMLFVDSMD
jgi:hypothetical protein